MALKVFPPERYADVPAYDEAMARMARVAARVAQIQQDQLSDVQDFVALRGIRMMELKWIDWYELGRLLTPGMLRLARKRAGDERGANSKT